MSKSVKRDTVSQDATMTGFTCLLLAVSLSADAAPIGQLASPRASIHFTPALPFTDYRPAVGDIVMSITENRKISLMYRLVLVGLPTHASVVVRMPNGELGVLEAGGGGEFRTRTTPLAARLAR